MTTVVASNTVRRHERAGRAQRASERGPVPGAAPSMRLGGRARRGVAPEAVRGGGRTAAGVAVRGIEDRPCVAGMAEFERECKGDGDTRTTKQSGG